MHRLKRGDTNGLARTVPIIAKIIPIIIPKIPTPLFLSPLPEIRDSNPAKTRKNATIYNAINDNIQRP